MKFIKDNKILIIIIAIVVLIIVGIILFLNSGTKKDSYYNNYKFGTKTVELPNTKKYTNEKLDAEHCLNEICIFDAVFYYNDEVGRVEYKITNTSNKEKSGYIKMVFDEESLIVVYKNLLPKSVVDSQSQYMGIEIKNKDDYKLEKLTKEEMRKLAK